MTMIDKTLDAKIISEVQAKGRSYLNSIIHHKDIADYLWQRFPMLMDAKYTNGMRLYWLMSGLEDFPDCACTKEGVHKNRTHRCRINGYETPYCSPHCAAVEGYQHSKVTKQQKHNDPNYNNSAQAAQTNMRLYGAANPFASKQIIAEIQKKVKPKRKQISEKMWVTRRQKDPDRYVKKFYELGIPRTFKYNDQFENETDRLFLEWLDWSPLENFEIRVYTAEERRHIKLRVKQYAKLQENEFKPSFSLDEWVACNNPWKEELEWICKDGHHFKSAFKPHYVEHLRCPVCNPYLEVGTSKIEKEMQAFIQELCPNNEIVLNTRDVIPPLELDDYVKDLHMAFEFNGLYSHCDIFKKKAYHEVKSNACDKCGIRLIHIFEDDWKKRNELCKSYICAALNKSINIDGSKYKVKNILHSEAKKFFDANDLFAVDMRRAKVSFGLFEGDDMLFCCTIAHLKANKYEVIGFCSKMGYNVYGGVDAICKQFIEQFNPSYIKCDLDRQLFSVSTLNDFTLFQTKFFQKPDFYYVNYGYSFKVRSWQINNEFISTLKTYDETKTVEENLAANKFAKIYDAGHLVVTWKK